MANTIKDIIVDEIITSFPPHREKWTDEEREEFIEKLCFQLVKFFNNQLD